MSSPDHSRPDDQGFAPFAPPGGGQAAPGASPPDGAPAPDNPGGADGPAAPYGPSGPYGPGDPYGPSGPYGPGAPYGPAGAPWDRPGRRQGRSGAKIALIVVAALVAVALLLGAGVTLLRGLGGWDAGVGGEPFGYGDDAVLDELWDRCEAGDGGACDDLFWDSPVDSEYEEFGNTCGNRFEHGPWSCEREI